jgi:DNA-binding SARP family transcriptional activator/Tfp pilus assembly protein PilF
VRDKGGLNLADGWRFRLVGPLEVRHDGVLVPVNAAKQRVVIAVLALAAGEPVTVERLIACLWGDQPPLKARNTVLNYVLRLRRALQGGAVPGPLVSSVAGYRLDVDADAVDVHRFGSLVRSARSAVMTGEPHSAATLLDEALESWRGEPLVDVPSEVLHREVVPGLVEQRLAALEQRIDLDLELGSHAERITELVALTTGHPLRERMWAQLMLALYRSGRTAEALGAYQQAHKVLSEELGIDPGLELRNLHQAVLTEDPILALTGPSARPSAQYFPAPRVVPRQLPPPSMHFVGRAAEVDRLGAQFGAAAASPQMVISAIGGTAGIGKTTLALHWAHLHADRFPDGQLYVNLRGFDPTGTPQPPMTALHGFLVALGVPAQEVPADPDERTALYRSRMAGRRILVVLDNARDAGQVRPLLPGTPGSLVLVTSRDQLAGLVALDGAVPLTLDVLTHDEARDLLVRRLGHDRVTSEKAAVDELIDHCARLPLALSITAAQAALQPTRPLAAFVDELRDVRRRLDTLTVGEATADVREVISWSYQTLTTTTARLFRLLSVYPGSDISLPAAASLAGYKLDATRRVLAELTRAHLVIEYSPSRYGMHDLLRAYATERVHTDDGESERQAALRRVVDFSTHTALSADLLLNPHRESIQFDPPVPGVHPYQPPDLPAALAWLDAEHPGLSAVQQAAAANGWHQVVWQLAWSLRTFQVRRGYRHDLLAVWQAALAAAAHLPGPGARVLAHRYLGLAFADLGRHDEAIRHGHHALELAQEHHDQHLQADIHNMLAWAWEQRGDRLALEHFLEHATRTLDLRRLLGQAVQEAQARNQLGWCLAQLGDYETARTHCETALAMQRRERDPEGEADTLDSLGYIADHTGRRRQAIEYYGQALSLFADLGNVLFTADTLDRLGHPHAALGEYEQARSTWQKALEMYRQQGRNSAADRVQRQLDTLGGFEG